MVLLWFRKQGKAKARAAREGGKDSRAHEVSEAGVDAGQFGDVRLYLGV